MNQITLIGHIGKDPETKEVGSTTLTKFSVATRHRIKKDDEWVDQTTWHNIVCWGKRGDVIAQYCSKGDMIGITGRQEHRKYEDKETGATKYMSEVVLNDFTFINAKVVSDQPKIKNHAPGMNEDEEIPF